MVEKKSIKTTIMVDSELALLVSKEAAKAGLPWATMLKVLAREAVATRERK